MASPSSQPRELAFPGARIGLFGGSFDPPHQGHLHVARTAKRSLGLDQVWWLVSPQNPLKPNAPAHDFERRIAAVEAMAKDPYMFVSDIERRWALTYTADTVRTVQARWPGVRFVWIMGADSMANLHRWRDWTSIIARMPIVIVARPGTTYAARFSRAAQRYAHARVDEKDALSLPNLAPPAWTYLTAPLNAASSSAIRARRK